MVLTVIGNNLFFRGYDTTNGWALWKSDGTVIVKDTDVSDLSKIILQQ